MPYTAEERRQLRKACTLVVPGFIGKTAAQEFREVADWCEANGVEHDDYGSGKLVEGFERKVADLLGKSAAVFMPSGIMAQLAAVRIWAEASNTQRIGLHPTSHLLAHEEEAFSALMHLQAVPLGSALRPMSAKDLTDSRQPMACVIVELPIRESGGRLPTWDELEALKSAASTRGTRLHMDGARLWECAAFYGKSYAAISTGFDSVYVSMYKGIDAFSGAVLAGDENFIAQARLWRRRMGGTLYHLSPLVASAAMQFDRRVAAMPALYQRTLELAAGLRPLQGLRVNPEVPQTNMLHLYFDASVDALTSARDRIAADAKCWLIGGIGPADVPGWSKAELYVGDNLLRADNPTVIPLFERLCEAFHTR